MVPRVDLGRLLLEFFAFYGGVHLAIDAPDEKHAFEITVNSDSSTFTSSSTITPCFDYAVECVAVQYTQPFPRLDKTSFRNSTDYLAIQVFIFKRFLFHIYFLDLN